LNEVLEIVKIPQYSTRYRDLGVTNERKRGTQHGISDRFTYYGRRQIPYIHKPNTRTGSLYSPMRAIHLIILFLLFIDTATGNQIRSNLLSTKIADNIESEDEPGISLKRKDTLLLQLNSKWNLFTAIKSGVTTAANAVARGIVAAVKDAGKGIEIAVKTIGTGVVKAANAVAGAFEDAYKAVEKVAIVVGKEIGKTAELIAKEMKHTVNQAAKEIEKAGGDIVEGCKATWNVVKAVGNEVAKAAKSVADGLVNAIKVIDMAAEVMIDGIKTTLKALGEVLNVALDVALAALKRFASDPICMGGMLLCGLLLGKGIEKVATSLCAQVMGMALPGCVSFFSVVPPMIIGCEIAVTAGCVPLVKQVLDFAGKMAAQAVSNGKTDSLCDALFPKCADSKILLEQYMDLHEEIKQVRSSEPLQLLLQQKSSLEMQIMRAATGMEIMNLVQRLGQPSL